MINSCPDAGAPPSTGTGALLSDVACAFARIRIWRIGTGKILQEIIFVHFIRGLIFKLDRIDNTCREFIEVRTGSILNNPNDAGAITSELRGC